MRIHRNEWIWGKTWVIVCDDGSGIIKVSQDPEEGVVLSGLSVIPENRNCGIGAELVKEAERIVQDEVGEEKICLCVESWNKDLVGWYKRLGYQVYDCGKEYIGMMKWFP